MDNRRNTALEKLGYKVLIVWERDYYENPEKVIDICIQFLKG